MTDTEYNLKLLKIDNKKIKENTWYILKDKKITEI